MSDKLSRSSSTPESADDYRKRLRKTRQEGKKAEAEKEAAESKVRIEYTFTAVTSTASASKRSSIGSHPDQKHVVYVPGPAVDANKVQQDGRYAYNGEAWWMVERVFAARNNPAAGKSTAGSEPIPDKRQVLVKWIGTPHLSWEPLHSLEGKDALKDFTQRCGDARHCDGPLASYERWYK